MLLELGAEVGYVRVQEVPHPVSGQESFWDGRLTVFPAVHGLEEVRDEVLARLEIHWRALPAPSEVYPVVIGREVRSLVRLVRLDLLLGPSRELDG